VLGSGNSRLLLTSVSTRKWEVIGQKGRALGQFQSESTGSEVCGCDLGFEGCTRDGTRSAFISPARSPAAGLGREGFTEKKRSPRRLNVVNDFFLSPKEKETNSRIYRTEESLNCMIK